MLLCGLLRPARQPARALLQEVPLQPPQQRGGRRRRDTPVPDLAAAHQHPRVRRRGAGLHRGGRDQVMPGVQGSL